MYLIYITVAILAGAALAVQPGVNNLVGMRLGNPILASLLSFIVGSILLLALIFVLRIPLPSIPKLGTLPWWSWLASGTIGAAAVTSALLVAPRIGAAVWISLFICGQIVLSILLDQFGWFGFEVHPVNLMRAIGAFLLVVGVTLIARF